MRLPNGKESMHKFLDIGIGPAQEIVVVDDFRDRVTKDMLQAIKSAYLPKNEPAGRCGSLCNPACIITGESTPMDLSCFLPPHDPFRQKSWFPVKCHEPDG